MQLSKLIGAGIWQFEFRADHIEVVQWSEPPTSTNQWVSILPNISKFYLRGDSITNISVVQND